MSKGYLLVALGKTYVEQAYLCAKSIKETQKINNVSIVTSDKVPSQFSDVFDKIIEVPWHDKDSKSFYITEHRWKVFHITPYEETVVLDTDIVFIDDVSHWWKYLSKKDIAFTTQVLDYRARLINNDHYRKAFTANSLPNIYCAFHYFKKNDVALEYYKSLEQVCTNHEKYYSVFVPKQTPKKSSMDINHAINILKTGHVDYELDCLKFTHMKSKIQGWENCSDNWIDTLPYYIGENFDIKLGNFKQHGILHYTEQQFCDTFLEEYYVS